MAYTTINKSTDYFNTKLYTGDGTSPRSITGVGFQPDFLWIKNRTGATGYEHRLMDAVRGSNKVLHSSTNGAENSEEYYTVGSFDSDGWTGRNGTGSNQVITGGNDSGYTFASWNWKANGAGSANTDGSISSTVSANTTSGFSIVKYTGNGTSGATIGHGLGSAPAMIIVKNLGSTEHWTVRHKDVTAGWNLYLNLTNTQDDNSTVFTTTAPTSSVFSVGDNARTNASGATYIAYCFAEKAGYSKIGSYTGNGSSSSPTFIYTGFKPKFVIVKNTSQTDSWFIHDDKRDGYNDDNEYLFADLTNAEGTNVNRLSMYSNGFNVPTTDKSHNVSGNNYIYIAIGQSLVGSNNVPCTAR